MEQKGLKKYFKAVYGFPQSKKDIVHKILYDGGWMPQEVVFVGDSKTDLDAAIETNLHFVSRVKLGDESLRTCRNQIQNLYLLDDAIASF